MNKNNLILHVLIFYHFLFFHMFDFSDFPNFGFSQKCQTNKCSTVRPSNNHFIYYVFVLASFLFNLSLCKPAAKILNANTTSAWRQVLTDNRSNTIANLKYNKKEIKRNNKQKKKMIVWVTFWWKFIFLERSKKSKSKKPKCCHNPRMSNLIKILTKKCFRSKNRAVGGQTLLKIVKNYTFRTKPC